MRAFLTACAVAIVVSVGAAVVLDLLVQEPVSVAFATTEARV
jgi:hypothetical protein